jgi:hypothetical protein
MKKPFVQERAGNRVAVGLADTCFPHGRPPCLSYRGNDLIDDAGGFFFGQ